MARPSRAAAGGPVGSGHSGRGCPCRRLEDPSPKQLKAGTYGVAAFFVVADVCDAGLWNRCHCLDHAGLRYGVVISAALQLVVATARDQAGSPQSALEATH